MNIKNIKIDNKKIMFMTTVLVILISVAFSLTYAFFN